MGPSNNNKASPGSSLVSIPTDPMGNILRNLSKPGLFWRPNPPAVLSYAIAVLSVAAALIISRLLDTYLVSAPASLFFCAVMFSAWLGGLGPGLLAVALSLLAFIYYFVPPFYSLNLPYNQVPRVIIFLLSTLFVGALSSAQRSAARSLGIARDDLRNTVHELSETNEALQAENADRRRAEALLREQTRLLDLTHDTVFVRDMNDVITYWNRGAEELYGWTREEAIDKVSHQLTQTTFPLPLEVITAELYRTGRWEGELVHTKRDGTQVVVASRWSLQRDEQQRPAAILETNNDITERKRVEAELRASEEQWRDVFENNPTMYFLVDAAGTVLSVNPFGAEQLGYTVTELVGQPVLSVFPESEREAVQRNINSCLEHIGLAQSWEARKVRKDGRVISVRETAKAVPRESGPIVLVACEDITEQKRAAEALRQAEADLAHVSRVTMMGELTASLAHEVNQPITAAVTNANTCVRWLAGETPNIFEARAAASRSAKDGTRAGEIISRIRLLFKKGTPERKLVDVNEIILEIVVLLGSEAMRHSISVRTQIGAHLPQVMGDPVQLQQVMMNLMMNSIDAMKDVDGTRELIIKSQSANDQLIVSVSDTGVGLPPQRAGEIFNAFFTTKLHGTGLGLSISRSIIESHDGRLWAADNSPRGATFCIALPTSVEAH